MTSSLASVALAAAEPLAAAPAVTPVATAPAITTPAPVAPAPAMDAATRAAILAEGAKAERDRLAAIDGLALPGMDALISELKADASVTPGDAAIRIVGAQKQILARQLASLADADAALPRIASAPTATGAPVQPAAATTAEGFAAEWDASAALQAEFADRTAYVALRKRETRRA